MKLTTQNDDAGRRLDRILRKALPDIPLSALHRLLRKGLVLVNGKTAKGDARVPAGASIELPAEEAKASLTKEKLPRHKPAVKFDILREGEGLLFINKAAGLAVHGGGEAANLDDEVRDYLRAKLPPSLSFKPGPLHRLDKPSSGIVVFALSLEAAKSFSALLREGKIGKIYLAILEGEVKKSETWEDMLERDMSARKTCIANTGSGRRALTRITPLAWAKRKGAYTFARLEIETGRTHQIRAQAAGRGHPLAGDRKYGGRPLPPPYKGFFLHAAELRLPGSATILPGIPRLIKAPLPEDFAMILKELLDILAP
jgi:23S rRNA pseudouridine955/2504/2580 synthase